jgi:predicted XRE-type DNA-binding protein
MNAEKRKRLEGAGWRFGSAADFLNLSPAEEAYVKMKLDLARELEAKRKARHLTQKALAEQLKTSQPRVAMMEKGDPSVSLDLIVRALLAMGVKPRKLATVL